MATATTPEPSVVVGPNDPVPITQEDTEQPHASVLPSLRRRRSSRDTNRIRISAGRIGSLQFNRLQQLFFDEQEGRRSRRRRFSNNNNNKNQPPVILRLDHRFALTQVHSAPNIYVIDNFLTLADLEYLRQSIVARTFQRSFVDNDQSESILDDAQRTSTFLSFGKQENAKIASIEQKAAQLMGCYSTDSIEPLQLVRYLPGQFFGVHHDMGDYNEQTGDVALPPKSVLVKRRLVTIFCYLNDLPPEAGGCTGFPACDNLRVQPKAGRAVVFCNVTPDGMPDPRTIHAGEVVVDRTNTTPKGTRNKQKASTVKAKKKCDTTNADLASGKKIPKVKPPVKYGLNIWVCET